MIQHVVGTCNSSYIKLFTKHFSFLRQKSQISCCFRVLTLNSRFAITTQSRWTIDLDAKHRMLANCQKWEKPFYKFSESVPYPFKRQSDAQ